MDGHVPRGRLSVALHLALVATACAKARPPVGAPSSTGPSIAITGATVDATNHVVLTYQITMDGKGAAGATAASLAPAFTLAGLSVDPVTAGLPPDPTALIVRPPVPAWRSYVLTGGETLSSLPIDGPGTPDAFVLRNTPQPGSESGGAVQDLGAGVYSYTFQNALPPGFSSAQTLRAGAWLQGTPGTAQTSTTFDFVPAGGAVQSRELVLDANCNRCHGLLRAHGGSRTGVKLCLTCHTYQNACAKTVDPAALTGATPDTNPNPLDLGRLVHRVHRGKDLPTLYVANPTIASSTRANVALPFLPGRNVPLAGQKYSVVSSQGTEIIFGQVINRTENGQPPTAAAEGIRFPQELRNCEACHGGAAQAAERFTDVSRRTCQGCHADVWFGDPSRIGADNVHYMHAGGAFTDDSMCYGCHIPTSAAPSVDADISLVHVAPSKSPSWSGLTLQIAGVANLLSGQQPTVQFTVSDRDGALSPLGNPTPAIDSTSPVPRKLGRVAITISGPTSPDYLTGNFASIGTAPVTESVPLTATADGNGIFSYTLAAPLPSNATGTWAVAMEARRVLDPSTDPAILTSTFYDPSTNAYSWPFTGETLYESADNPVVYVDVSAGSLSGGKALPRRQVVAQDNCDACHRALTAHGGLRQAVAYCVMCHAPDATDWAQRPKGADGNVALTATFDDIEERTIHFKALIHRIHTGARTGSAELDQLARPFVVYGDGGTPQFLDDVRFPGNLADCTLCHANGSYAIESIPAGALPTVANETATLQHGGTPAHVVGEPSMLPTTSACLGCHDTGAARTHAQQMTPIEGREQCGNCHGLSDPIIGVKAAHGLQ